MFIRSLAIATTFITVLTALSAVHAAPATASSRGPMLPESGGGAQPVLTFQAWKSLRLEEARLVLERLTLDNQVDRTALVERSPGEKQAVVKSAPEIAPIRTAAMRPTKGASRADSRIEQAQINLEIAQELTLPDYLQIYLSRFRSREMLLDVARRMSPDEIVDLILAHQKVASGAQIAEHSPTPRLAPTRSN